VHLLLWPEIREFGFFTAFMESAKWLHPYFKFLLMKPVVAINEPCHESWEKMSPEQQGRFCDKCCKVVVDFTKMSNNAIAKYLQQHSEQKTCGRFKVEQVAKLPAKRIRFSFNIQRFAAAVLLAFGTFLFSSCGGVKPREHEVMGDVAYEPDTTIKHKVQQVDTLTEQHVLGKPSVCEKPANDSTTILIGDVEYIPDGDPK